MVEQNKRPVGRPTKYNDELQALADTYIFNYKEQGDVIPSRVGLLKIIEVKITYQWW